MDKLIRKINNKDKIIKLSLEMQCLKDTQKNRDWIIHRINIGLVTVLRKNLWMASHRDCLNLHKFSDIIRKTLGYLQNPRKH